jgi:ribosomal protein S18 acetylase RimI-like enzyme
MSVSIATTKDISSLVELINGAYRGDASKKGWTTEADMVSGDLRTDEANVNELMQLPGAVFLKYTNEKNDIEGCVFLQKREGKMYLGMLCVSPVLQAKGTGKQLMAAAAVYAKEQDCPAIFMRVISIRHELIAWYERQGYINTGKKEPFPDDTKFGAPTQPLEFIILEKQV